jgi:hypothetical protein
LNLLLQSLISLVTDMPISLCLFYPRIAKINLEQIKQLEATGSDWKIEAEVFLP